MDSDNKQLKISDDDTIDIVALIKTLWQEKKIIASIVAATVTISIFYALSLPNIYQGTTLLAPNESSSSPQASSISQNLASFAGINIGGGAVDKTDIAIATLQSHMFLTNFIKRREIIIPLMATVSWDKTTNTPIYDDSIYNQDEKVWEINNGKAPSDWKALKKLKSILSISTDTETGLITLSIEFPVPDFAKQWIVWLVHDINELSRQREINNTQKEISYLQGQLEKTSMADIRDIFFQLIEEHLKKVLIAETKEEFVLTTIDPAYVPEDRIKPSRTLIVILGGILGGIIGFVTAIVRGGVRRQRG